MIIYISKPGDTLFSVSTQYGYSVSEIAAANGLDENAPLVVGQAIVIPSPEPSIIGNMAVNGYCYSFIDKELLYKNLPYLTYLSVFSYGFTAEGELIAPEDTEIVNIAISYGVSPVMVLTTLTENGTFSSSLASQIFSDTAAQDNLIENILTNLYEKDYYALDIDFEFIPPEDRERFEDFLRRIQEALSRNNFKLFISLPPKYYPEQTGILYEAYNYGVLGSIADLSLLMTYEWGYTYGPPMAVSPLNQVSRIISYAKTEIPPYQMTMGVPNYGYDWALPYVRGSSKARSIGNPEAIETAVQYNAEILYDDTAQSPYFYYTDNDGNKHVVWFEDARSIYAKLLLANENRLHGIGIWNLMRDFPQMRTVISQNFNVVKETSV